MTFHPPSLGCRPSLGDFRDFCPDDPRVQQMLDRMEDVGQVTSDTIPDCVCLREYFPQTRHQGTMNTSSVHAGLALVEYFERRTGGDLIEPSRMFVYHTARSLLRVTGDSGCDLRTVFKAIAWFGFPPESHWPYEVDKLDDQPSSFLFAYSRDYRSMVYVRLDLRNQNGRETLDSVRCFLAAGFPVAFGFPVPSSLTASGDIPYRPTLDSIQGGQAVVAVGYDDLRAGSTRGALQIRSSWGADWGQQGYGWLPYRYVEEQLAADFWTILQPRWAMSGELRRPQVRADSSRRPTENLQKKNHQP